MIKQFFIDSLENINIKTTFFPEDKVDFNGIPLDGEAVPAKGINLHVSIKRSILLDCIQAMASNKGSIYELTPYADVSLSEIGEPVGVSIRRDEDMMIRLYYKCRIEVDGVSYNHEFDMRPYIPMDLIHFLTEFK
jgi:hypothetical protein